MSLEVPIRKEIASFESKPVFGLTARQLITTGIALPIGIGMFFLFYRGGNISAGSNAAILTTIPIFAIGLFKKDGYTIEQYLPIILAHRFKPQKIYYLAESALLEEYMTEEEWKEDISRKLLTATPGRTTASQEATIQFQPDKKHIRRMIKADLKRSRQALREIRKELRALKRTERKQKTREWLSSLRKNRPEELMETTAEEQTLPEEGEEKCQYGGRILSVLRMKQKQSL